MTARSYAANGVPSAARGRQNYGGGDCSLGDLDGCGLGHAAEEMNGELRRVSVAEIELPTEADYKRVLKNFATRLKAEIKAFHDARKDRRIKEG
jgi:hypothetical protein